MTAKQDMKQKNVSPNTERGTGWIAIIIAFVFSLLMSFGIGGFSVDPYSDGLLFYPLLVITHYSPFQAILWAAAAIIFVGLLIYAARRHWHLALVALVTFFVGGFFLFFSFGWGVAGEHIKLYQTLSYQNRVYYLVAQWEAAYDLGDETERYHVLECDATGLMCEHHRTPYYISLRDYGGRFLNEFDTSGELFIDEANQTVKLRVGDEVYPLHADPY